MNSVADTKTYAEILRDIPAFSRCAPDVLDHFVTESVFTMHAGAGREISSWTDSSRNLYVLVAGSASLDAGDNVRVSLEPGDYFGGDSGVATVTSSPPPWWPRRMSRFSSSAPNRSARLQQAGSRRRHPSNADWSPEVAVPSLRLLPSRRRPGVLAGSAS